MSDTAIKFENISKQYRLGKIGTGTLSHDLKRWWTVSVRRKEDPYLKIGAVNDSSAKADSEYVWALRDINLEVKQGEVLGIIGKNGAGKSTLLKLLSRVTTPTTGRILSKGRIASLLEVGTGFHPEMTGRENIFMNGSIMGMTKAEITRKFDEIVDFAGVEKYIDTPVKRYSSGMIVRLGFAIAAHLEPEILVVDEVLAVGDAEFQNKAIGKMQDVSQEHGRTVLFVSHNMAAVGDLCKNGIVLYNGSVIKTGPAKEVIASYLESAKKIAVTRVWDQNDTAPGTSEIKIRKGYATDKKMGIAQYHLTTSDICIEIEYEVLQDIPFFTHGINLHNSSGTHIFSSHDSNSYQKGKTVQRGVYLTKVWIPGNLLQEGDYLLSFAAMRYNPFTVLFHEKDLLRLQVVDTMNQSARPEDCKLEFPGVIRPKLFWEERKYNKS